MKKQQRIFRIVCCVLLLVMSVSILSLYDNVRDSGLGKKQSVTQRYGSDFELFTLSLAQKLDPEYELITFGEDVPESARQEIRDALERAMYNASVQFEHDPDFIYAAQNVKTKKSLSANTDKLENNKEDPLFYASIEYGTDGALVIDGDVNTTDYQEFHLISLIRSYMNIYYTETGMGSAEMFEIADITIPVDQVKINVPENFKITYLLPNEISMDCFAYYYLNSWDRYNSFTGITLCVSTLILMLFMIFYPIQIVEQTGMFDKVRKWKSGFQFLILTAAVSVSFFAVMITTGYTLNDYFVNIMEEFHIGFGNTLVMAINLIVWCLTLLCILLSLFQIKYIFVHGFLRYLREDTLTSDFFRFCKRKINRLADIDLSDKQDKTLLKFVLINALIICVITTTWVFGYFFAFIYACVSFFWVKKHLQKMQQDYDQLSHAAQKLGEGDFNIDVNVDMGIFNGLKDDFANIRNGFEKAVKEETKSQNMKTELISNVSHDLKTPLTCIKNYIVLLQDDTITEDTRHEYLDNLNQYSNRLTTLIEDLFDVSKVNSGNMKLELMDINIIALIEQAQAECSDMLEEKQLRVITNFSSQEIILHLDGGKTYRLFENLYTNIGKYAMPSTRVYIDVTEVEDEVTIIFKNMSQEEMNFTAEEIVDRFVRGDKSRHERGSGLGLAIVKSFTEVQGGSFTIDIDGDLFKAILQFKKHKDQA